MLQIKSKDLVFGFRTYRNTPKCLDISCRYVVVKEKSANLSLIQKDPAQAGSFCVFKAVVYNPDNLSGAEKIGKGISMSTATTGLNRMGPYADTNWFTVCKEGLKWLCGIHNIKIDPTSITDTDLWDDQVGVPAAYATTCAYKDIEVRVGGEDQLWQVCAYALREADSSYYYLSRLSITQIMGTTTRRLYNAELLFDVEGSTRSFIFAEEGSVPDHQLLLSVV